jgi:hypothetical protein
MKKTLTILMLFIVSNKLKSQCVNNGITTDPAAPVNNQLPSKTNLYFNWTQPSWQNNSSCEPLNTIESPFYKIDNLEILRASKDMQPQDGWELLRREFGYTDQNTLKPQTPEHTYFVLYNKYTGILRILLKVCRSGADYNGAKITIKFDATSNFQSSLLDFTFSNKTLEQTHVANPVAQSASVFVNDKTKWFYADFPMTYDPCTCVYKSKLNIVSQLIQNSQISLQGALTGTITSISNGQGSVSNDGNLSFKDFVSGAEKFKKGYSSVDNFITETKNVATTFPNSASTITALTNLQNGLKNNQFLKTGLAAVPWLKAASGLLDFFSGGGKTSPQLTQLMPMSVNLALKVSGTMTTANQYHDIKFSNPGTLDAQNDPDIYPFYNEILGVFNFINGPKGTYAAYEPERGGNYYKFKLTTPMKWVLNPASDLQLQDAQVAFVADFNIPGGNTTNTNPPASVGQGFDFLEGKNAENNHWTYRTDYVDINCLGTNDLFNFSYVPSQIKAPYNNKVYLKFIFNLKRISNPSAQNVLLILKYPITWGTGTLTGTPFNPAACTGGAISQATITETTAFCNSTTYTANRFMRNRPIDTLANAIEDYSIKASPNPVSNIVNLSGVISKDKLIKVQIVDMLGAVQLEFNEQLTGIFSKSYTIGNLPNGVYLVKTITSSGNSKSIKIVIGK